MSALDPSILGVGTAVPSIRLCQRQARNLAAALFSGGVDDADRLLGVFDRSGVHQRYVAVEEEWFAERHSFAERNALYEREAFALSMQSSAAALADAGVSAESVGAIFFVSSTGLATPSIDSRLQLGLGLGGAGVSRDATFGHGCAGGVGALGRAAAWCRAHPDRHALVVATELCSLAFQPAQQSSTNLVAASLFADGSAAVVIGPQDARPRIIAEGGYLWPDTADIMGWEQGDDGFEVFLSRRVPAFLRRHVAESLEPVCAEVRLDPEQLDHHVLHPGGAAVLRALCEGLGLPPQALTHSRGILADYGNMSSPTALFVLQRHLRAGSMRSGDVGVISAMGPGFAAEHVIFEC